MDNIEIVPPDHPSRKGMAEVAPPSPGRNTQILQLIERIVTDPKIDVEKMERVFALQERLEERDYLRAKEDREHSEQTEREQRAAIAKRAFEIALINCQKAMSVISRDSANEQTRSRYASLAQIDRVARPIYTAQNLSLSFTEAEAPSLGEQDKMYLSMANDIMKSLALTQEQAKAQNEKLDQKWVEKQTNTAGNLLARIAPKMRVKMYVTHACEGVDSYTREYYLDVVVDGKGPQGGAVMTLTHAKMAGFTYGRRGHYNNLFNLASADDDGNKAGGSGALPLIDDAQTKKLYAEIEASDSNLELFLNNYKVTCVEELNVKQYEHGMALLIEKKRRKAKLAEDAKANKVSEDAPEWTT